MKELAFVGLLFLIFGLPALCTLLPSPWIDGVWWLFVAVLVLGFLAAALHPPNTDTLDEWRAKQTKSNTLDGK